MDWDISAIGSIIINKHDTPAGERCQAKARSSLQVSETPWRRTGRWRQRQPEWYNQHISLRDDGIAIKNASPILGELVSLLADLPPESLQILEQFARFLREQARQGQTIQLSHESKTPSCLYPTEALPVSSLDNWLNLVSQGYEGDMLAITEALYDEA
jgi:hypothetical protein